MADDSETALQMAKSLLLDYKKSYTDVGVRIYAVHGKQLRGQATVCYVLKPFSGNNAPFEVLRVDLLTGVAKYIGKTPLTPVAWKFQQQSRVEERQLTLELAKFGEMSLSDSDLPFDHNIEEADVSRYFA